MCNAQQHTFMSGFSRVYRARALVPPSNLNFEAAVKDLFGKGLRDGAQVLLSGDSAGGMGTFINVGWLADALPWASVKGALVIDSPGRRALFAYLENGSTTTRTSPGGHPPVTPGAMGHRQTPRRARLDPYLDYGSVTSVEFMCCVRTQHLFIPILGLVVL